MPGNSAEFLKRLQATFVTEAAEHCEALSAGLLAIENAPEEQQRPLIEKIFRSAHSLKGAARAVSLSGVEAVCQRLETVFERWRRGSTRPHPAAFDTLHRAVDQLRRLAASPAAQPAGVIGPEVAALLAEIERIDADDGPSPQPAAPATTTTGATTKGETPSSASPGVPLAAPRVPAPAAEISAVETVRIAIAKVERVLYGAEELLAVKATLRHRVADVRDALALIEQARRGAVAAQAALRGARQAVDATTPERARDLEAILEGFERTHDASRVLEQKLGALGRALERDHLMAGKLVDTLREEAKELLLLPFGHEQAFFSRLVRDLARDEEKQVNFVCRGAEVELDKRVLEEMKDPLVHLLRNSVDHGMERPAARTAAGKPARGTITLAATPLDHHRVEIRVEDDGAGIDFEAVRTSAVRRGLVAESAAAGLSADELLAFIFRPDVSTARMVTEISGRGVGLAIVQERVEALGGRLSVHTERGRGTSFRLVLPAAQSAFRGILVAVREHWFVLPAARVECVHRAAVAEIRTVENRETIPLQGRTVALARLADVLELGRDAAAKPAAQFLETVVVGSRERSVALAVDEILGEEELLVKPLRKPLSRVRNVAGATVLGSGRVVPILNAADLVQSAARVASGPAGGAAAPARTEARRRSVLVAEDSITSRMLLKNIIESAGYTVKTAVDGIDALTVLRSESFDLVVSDVEMPRLDGFGLTRAIRADRRLAEIPVILVTALAKREDRERGIDAGANAYLVKSDFDQSNLIEAIRRYV